MHHAIFRKRQKPNKEPIYDIIALSHYIADVAEYRNSFVAENYKHETKSVLSNLKQELLTSSDNQSLPQSTTPKVLCPQEERRREREENNMAEKNEIFSKLNFTFYQE